MVLSFATTVILAYSSSTVFFISAYLIFRQYRKFQDLGLLSLMVAWIGYGVMQVVAITADILGSAILYAAKILPFVVTALALDL